MVQHSNDIKGYRMESPLSTPVPQPPSSHPESTNVISVHILPGTLYVCTDKSARLSSVFLRTEGPLYTPFSMFSPLTVPGDHSIQVDKDLPLSCFLGHPSAAMRTDQSLFVQDPGEAQKVASSLRPHPVLPRITSVTAGLSSSCAASHLIPPKAPCPLPHLLSPRNTQLRQAVVFNVPCRKLDDSSEEFHWWEIF